MTCKLYGEKVQIKIIEWRHYLKETRLETRYSTFLKSRHDVWTIAIDLAANDNFCFIFLSKTTLILS